MQAQKQRSFVIEVKRDNKPKPIIMSIEWNCRFEKEPVYNRVIQTNHTRWHIDVWFVDVQFNSTSNHLLNAIVTNILRLILSL